MLNINDIIKKLNCVLRFSIFPLFFLCYFNTLNAQKNDYLYKVYNTDNGLSENTVHCIFQHTNNLIYIGTGVGLNVLDGENVIEIKTSCFQAIRSIIPYKNDSLILVKENAICIINTFNYGYREKDFSDEIRNAINKGILLNNSIFASSESGLVKIDLCNFKYTYLSKNMKDRKNETMSSAYPSICFSNLTNNVYMGCRKGLIIYNILDKKALCFTSDTFTTNAALKFQNNCYNIKYTNGKLFFRTNGNDIMCFNESNNSLTLTNYTKLFIIDESLNIPLVDVFDNDTNSNEYLSNNEINKKYRINCIYKNKKNETLIGTFNGLVIKNKNNKMYKIDTLMNELKTTIIYTQKCYDYKNYKYLNYESGLLEINTNTQEKKYYTIPKKHISAVQSFFKYKYNMLCLIGNFGYIGFSLETKKYVPLKLFSNAMEEKIKTLTLICGNYDSATNHIIVCPFRSPIIVKDFNKNNEYTWNGNDSGWFRTARCLFYLGNYDYYFGGNGSDGVMRYNFKTKKGHFYSPNKFSKIGVATPVINQLLFYNNALFLASKVGFLKIDTASKIISKITFDGKIFNEYVQTISIIKNQLYVSTRNNLYLYIENKNLIKITAYENTKPVGIPFQNNNYIQLPFGEKLLTIDFPNLNDNTSVNLSHIGINNQWHNLVDKQLIQLNYKENDIVFMFGTEKIIKPDVPLKIYYRLSKSQTWLLVNNYRIDIGNLSFGKHTLEYYTTQWGNKSAIKLFSIVIKRPWWASYWFYSLIAVFIVLAGIFIARKVYIKKLAKQKREMLLTIHSIEKERMRISRDLHDSVGSKLSSIKLIGETLHNSPNNKLAEQLPNIIDETILDIRQIINELNPHSLQQNGLIETINAYIKGLKNTNNINIIFSTNTQNINVTENITIHLFRICQEAINNAIKHSNSSQIILKFNYIENTNIELNITDNGNGFLQNNEMNIGNGLNNMRIRSEILNGTFQIHSAINKGTEIKISISLHT